MCSPQSASKGVGTVCRLALLLLAAALCGFPPLPVHAQLEYAASTPHGSLWARIYGRLPAKWTAHGPISVREVSDEEMDRFVEQFGGPNDAPNSVVDGCYQADPDGDGGLITLRESLRGDSAALVFAHEYGHFVWNSALTGGDRYRYRRLWRTQKRAGRLVTTYAADSDEEGFAEAFAYFTLRSVTLRRADARSWKFLAELQPARRADISLERTTAGSD